MPEIFISVGKTEEDPISGEVVDRKVYSVGVGARKADGRPIRITRPSRREVFDPDAVVTPIRASRRATG